MWWRRRSGGSGFSEKLPDCALTPSGVPARATAEPWRVSLGDGSFVLIDRYRFSLVLPTATFGKFGQRRCVDFGRSGDGDLGRRHNPERRRVKPVSNERCRTQPAQCGQVTDDGCEKPDGAVLSRIHRHHAGLPRLTHNPKVAGSNPAPATKKPPGSGRLSHECARSSRLGALRGMMWAW